MQNALMRRSPSLWAEQRRYIRVKHPNGTVQWQPWSFTGYEFLRAIHDCMHPRVCVQKCSQVGATELLVNRVLHMLDCWGLDTMHLLPAADEATDFSSGRFRETVDNSPGLDGLFTKVDNMGHKVTHTGANAYFRGGNSRSKVKSSPANFLAIDEYAEIAAATVELARDRLSGQPMDMRWELNVSTPTYPGLNINKDYLDSDRRVFTIPCPTCHDWTAIDWWLGRGEDQKPNLLELDDGTMAMRCAVEGCMIPEAAKPALRARGRWLATRPDGASRSGPKPSPGFQIPGHMSSTMPWANMLQEYHRCMADPDGAVLREYINGTAGLPFVEGGMAIDKELLRENAKNHGLRTGIHLAPIMVAGVDAGVRGHYMTIMGTGEGAESRGMVQRVVYCRGYDEVKTHVLQHKVTALVVDAQPNTEKSRELQRDLMGMGVTVYLSYFSANAKFRMKWDHEAPDGPQVVAHRTTVISEAMGKLVGGTMVLPSDVSAEVLDHCANMRKVVEPDSSGNLKANWVADGPDHFADSLTYANMALEQASTHETEDWNTDHGLEAADEYNDW